MSIEFVLMAVVLAAGFYMAWNIGANDVANAMGTSVGSGALTLKQAVIVAAVLEFSGALLFGSHVSETVQKGIIDITSFSHEPLILVYGMLACLLAAGGWLQIASYYGWPVSTTHTIVGSIVGFGFVYGGVEAVQWDNVSFIVSSWVLSPILGGIFSFLLFTLLKSAIFYAPDPILACKKIAPLIFGLVAFVLTLVLIFNGLKNLDLKISLWQAAGYSFVVGCIAVYASWIWLKKSVFSAQEPTVSGFGSVEAFDELEQAQHHLLQAGSNLTEEQRDRLNQVVEQMDLFKTSIHEKAITEVEDANAKHYGMIEQVFSYLQIMSACLMAFAHGANDVANAIGPLGAAIDILQTGTVSSSAGIPTWVLAMGAFGIVVGLATWGWRVIETIGKKITELTPTRGFAAEFGAALTIVLATRLGMPISTTHTLVGSVIGVGLARGMGALNLSMTRDIFISWIVTVPAGAALTIFIFYIVKFIFHF